MGLTKQYLRYVETERFNIISSNNCNVCFVVYKGEEGRYLASGGCENVNVWDLKIGEKVQTITGEDHVEVSFLAASPDKIHLAVGFTNGRINFSNIGNGDIKTVFSGHHSAISYLAFDAEGHRLASGGKDTEIILWDIITESGLQRLSGHKGAITSLVFMKQKNILISSSKDTYIKFWDLDTIHCFHTIAAHVTEVWGISLIGNDEYLVAGSNDSELMVWRLEQKNIDETNNVFIGNEISVTKAGSILREGRGRLYSMTVDNSGQVLVVHGMDNHVESFLFLTKSEALVKANKRKLKDKKKAAKYGPQ